MNIVKLQDIKSTHRNPLHSYTLIMRNAGLEEAQAAIETARRNINNLRYGIINSMDMNLSELQELVIDREACCNSWGRKESDTTE